MNDNGQALEGIVVSKESARYVKVLLPDWLGGPYQTSMVGFGG